MFTEHTLPDATVAELERHFQTGKGIISFSTSVFGKILEILSLTKDNFS